MKYLLVVFAVMVLSLWWLNHKYKVKAREHEQAKAAHVVKQQPADTPKAVVKQSQPVRELPGGVQPEAGTEKPSQPVAANPESKPETATAKVTEAPASANPPATVAPVDPNKPPPPPKDWPQICYNASMQAERAMRRRMDGALPAEVNNMGMQTDPEYRENLQGVMGQVNATPVTSDFAQQQLDVDNIKSSTYNNCMAGHR